MEFTCPKCSNIINTRTEMQRAGFCPVCEEALAGEMSGLCVSDYLILAELGRGSNGAVFLANQMSLNREVALKLLPSDFTANPEDVNNFFYEAKAAAHLSHAHIVQAIEAGVSKHGIYFFAMELVDGETIEKQLLDFGALKYSTAITIARKISSAMEYAWETCRMIHGDIKPANIILTTSGEPKLADLGLAQFGGAATFEQATPLYISPEIASGREHADFHADIYSFGIMLYEMLAGEPPFFDLEPERVIKMHLEDEPEPLEKPLGFFDPALSAFIDSMIAKKQENRPSSWHKVTEFLRRYDIAAQLNEN